MAGSVPSGLSSLIELNKGLLALHHQLLNLDAREQQVGVYGVMAPRWAAEPGSSDKDVQELREKVIGRRHAQDVRIVDAIRVVRELIKEHGMATDVPQGEVG